MTLARVVPALLVAGLALAACSASHPRSAHSTTPPASPTPAATAREPARQLGLDIDFYANPGTDTAAVAQQEVTYIKGLHANAVSISFPFDSNVRGTAVTANPRTPALSQLGALITDAQGDGLAVTLRPLLDEKSIGEPRAYLKPADLASWFASYQRFLLPYAALAQTDHVPVFTVGTELTKFATAREWATLGAAVRGVYHGQLAYSNNWTEPERSSRGRGGPGVTEMVNAYPPFHLADNATVAALTTAWTNWARPLPQGTVLSELGLAAQSGAYAHPYQWGSTTAPINSQIQVNWYTAACKAVAADDQGDLLLVTVLR